MKRISPLTYEINLPGATENVNVHINRLKKSPPLADSCDISHEWATKRRGRPRTLAGHPKKAKIVKELQRPMTVIPIEVDVPPPQPRRKRGRPKKAPIVTTELVEAPKFAALRPTETSPPTLLIQPFTPNPHTLIHRPIALSPHPPHWVPTPSTELSPSHTVTSPPTKDTDTPTTQAPPTTSTPHVHTTCTYVVGKGLVWEDLCPCQPSTDEQNWNANSKIRRHTDKTTVPETTPAIKISY